MSNARTLASTINSSSQIVVPSGGIAFTDLALSNDPTTANEAYVMGQDGYETGTWTATLTPQTSGTITLSTNTCSYIKIGNSVTVTGYLIVSGVSSPTPTGFLQLSTLPFTIGSRRGTLSLIGEIFVAGNNILNLWPILVTGNTYISIYKGGGVNPSTDSAQMIQTDSRIWFTGTYFV